MLELLQDLVPDEFGKLSALRTAPDMASEIYQTLSPWNLSTKVLARIPQYLIVLRVDNVRWSDFETRELVEHTYKELNMVPLWNLRNPIPSNPTAAHS